MRAFIYTLMGFMLLVPVLVSAQTFQGGVRGAVRDADGGVLPGTAVTLTNEATNVARTSITNERGEYVFAAVAPGVYAVHVELAGFGSFTREGLEVGVADFLVVDVTLQVGGIAESVTVTGETPLIETATASIASAIDKAQMEVLPTPGRNVFIMAVTTPGVVHGGDPVFVRMQDQTNASLISLGGGPLRGNNYTLDGVSISDMNGRSNINPSFESLEEMKVQLQTYDSEMGRTSGGVFNSIHKSGSNAWHGSALWQTRPQTSGIFGRAKTFFQERAGQDNSTPPYNLWGGSFGGPIITDRTFFWAAHEGYTNTDTRTAQLNLPTRAMANGDFSGTGITLTDPLTGAPFPGNVIPPGRRDPAGVSLANLLADVSDVSGTTPTATALIASNAWQASGNINHSFSDSWQLTGTYMYYESKEPTNTFYRELLGLGTFEPVFDSTGILFRDVNVIAINSTHIPTDDSVLTLRFGYTRFNDSLANPDFGVDEHIALGFDADQMNALGSTSLKQFPYIITEGYGADFTHGSWGTNDTVWKSVEGSGVYSKFVGSHTLKVGGQYRQLSVDDFSNDPLNFNFESAFSEDNLADMVLGLPTRGAGQIGTPATQFINYYAGFIQDDWRVNEKLVLNLGVRIENEQGLQEKNDGMAVGFDRDTAYPIQVPGFRPLTGGILYAGVDGNPTHAQDPKAVKVGPRAGFAYSVTDSTVLRGGYGVFWAPHTYGGSDQDRLARIGFSANTDFLQGTTATLSSPFPFGVGQPVGNTNGRLQNQGQSLDVIDQFRESPYVQQWSFGMQHELTPAVALSIGYAGSKGTNLTVNGTPDQYTDINQLAPEFLSMGAALNDQVPNPFFGTALANGVVSGPTVRQGQLLRPFPQFNKIRIHQRSTGRSRYDSLRFELEKRFRGNWGARVNYTWADQRDNVMERPRTIRTTSTDRRVYRAGFEDNDFGPSRISVTHQVNLNGLYRFPSPDGGAAEVIAGGWSVSVAAIFRSGMPYVIRQSSNWGNDFGYDYIRPNLTGVDPVTSGSTEDRVDNFINEAAYANAPDFTFGNAPHTDGDLRTPALYNWDVSLEKMTSLGGGGAQLSLRFEWLNMLNQPNWGGPRHVFGAAQFGQITSQAGFPRVFMFMAKFIF